MTLPRVALVSASTGVQAGGAEAYTMATARGLLSFGAPVTLLHGKGPACSCQAMGAQHMTGPMLSRDGFFSRLLQSVGLFRTSHTSPYDLEVLSRGILSPRSWKALRGFDLVEVQYPTEALFFRFASPSALKVLHLHGPSMPKWLPPLCRILRTEPDVVVTCSEWSRQELLARNMPWPVEVNHNGIDESLFRPTDAPSSGRQRPFRVGFTGRLSASKGLSTLAKTAGLCGPGFEFHVTGPVEGSYDLPSAPNIIYGGRMDSPGVANFLRSMDCFYFPTLRESFGIAAVEAMSTGLPVIASDVGGLREIIRTGLDGILVPERDSEAAASHLRELSQSLGRCQTLGKAARETVLRRFTAMHTARRLLEIHERWSQKRIQVGPCLEAVEAVS